MPRVDSSTLDQVFTYHNDPAAIPKYQAIRDAAKVFAQVVLDNAPDCADRTVALRGIRETVMNANAAIALNGLI